MMPQDTYDVALTADELDVIGLAASFGGAALMPKSMGIPHMEATMKALIETPDHLKLLKMALTKIADAQAIRNAILGR